MDYRDCCSFTVTDSSSQWNTDFVYGYVKFVTELFAIKAARFAKG